MAMQFVFKKKNKVEISFVDRNFINVTQNYDCKLLKKIASYHIFFEISYIIYRVFLNKCEKFKRWFFVENFFIKTYTPTSLPVKLHSFKNGGKN